MSITRAGLLQPQPRPRKDESARKPFGDSQNELSAHRKQFMVSREKLSWRRTCYKRLLKLRRFLSTFLSLSQNIRNHLFHPSNRSPSASVVTKQRRMNQLTRCNTVCIKKSLSTQHDEPSHMPSLNQTIFMTLEENTKEMKHIKCVSTDPNPMIEKSSLRKFTTTHPPIVPSHSSDSSPPPS
jgi:hypothetical protein